VQKLQKLNEFFQSYDYKYTSTFVYETQFILCIALKIYFIVSFAYLFMVMSC